MVDLSAESVESIDTTRSAVSWPAIFGGAVVGAAVGVVLFILGAGIGLSSISPWRGASPGAFGVGAAIWLIVIEWASAAVGSCAGAEMMLVTFTSAPPWRPTSSGRSPTIKDSSCRCRRTGSSAIW